MKVRKKKLFKIYIIVIPATLLIIFLISKNINLFLKYRELDSQYQQDLTKIESEKQKEIDLSRDLEFLETEKGQERLLIEKNNLKKAGEQVIKILDYDDE